LKNYWGYSGGTVLSVFGLSAFSFYKPINEVKKPVERPEKHLWKKEASND
jgi:hypothetical protein